MSADQPKDPELAGANGRTATGRFGKGNPGGPGRRKMPEETRVELEKLQPAMHARLAKIIAAGRDADALEAIRFVHEALWGKPAQAITGGEEGDKPLFDPSALVAAVKQAAGG